MCPAADDEAHDSHAPDDEPGPSLEEREWWPAGPLFIYQIHWRQGTGVASGGRRPAWTVWKGSRRPTSDVKTARQTLSSVTLVIHAS